MRLLPDKFLSRLQEQGLSIAQCAALADVQPDTIYDNLRPGRRPHFSTVWRLAKVLGCQVVDIADVREFIPIELDEE